VIGSAWATGTLAYLTDAATIADTGGWAPAGAMDGAASAWEPRPGRWLCTRHLTRSYRQLQPLWQALCAVIPEIALPPEPGTNLDRIGFKLYRRVIEIRDGQLMLRAYANASVTRSAEFQARLSGLREEERAVTVEAALLATAINAKTAGATPGDDETGGLPVVEPGYDLAHEVDWLVQVSRAFARSPIVRQLRRG